MGPVPGLEVAPESLQVHGREVGSDTFSQPPLPMCCAGTARLAELVPKMFPSNPPEEEEEEDTARSLVPLDEDILNLSIVSSKSKISPKSLLKWAVFSHISYHGDERSEQAS